MKTFNASPAFTRYIFTLMLLLTVTLISRSQTGCPRSECQECGLAQRFSRSL